MNWLLVLPPDEIQALIEWMCATGSTTTLKMLAALKASSQHFRGLVDARVANVLKEAPRQAVLTSPFCGGLPTLVKCHTVFKSLSNFIVPMWQSVEDAEDGEFDRLCDANERAIDDVVGRLYRLLHNGSAAPEAVMSAALAMIIANTSDADGDQAYLLLGGFFGTVDASGREMTAADATRMGAVLAASGLSWRLPHFLDKMVELQSDLERTAQLNARLVARRPNMPAQQRLWVTPLEQTENVPLALLRGWCRTHVPAAVGLKQARASSPSKPQGRPVAFARGPCAPRTRAPQGAAPRPPDIRLVPDDTTKTLTYADLMRAVVDAVDASLVPPPEGENADEPPATPGSVREYQAVATLVTAVVEQMFEISQDGVDNLPAGGVEQVHIVVGHVAHLKNVLAATFL